MPNTITTTPFSLAAGLYKTKGFSEPEEKDIWFDAIDQVDMDDTWFDARNEFASGQISAEKYAESLVPFTEDCRRCIQQLIKALGEYKQSELLSTGLARMLPGLPVNIVMAADSLYIAITERRNIDSAVLHSLGLASCCLPDNLNMIARLAGFIRETVLNWTDASYLKPNEWSPTTEYLFTALAITAIAARYWMTDEGAPQRGFLRLPAFMANLLIRADSYWRALGNMARNESPPEEPAPRIPAFEVDTCMETVRKIYGGTGCDMMASLSEPSITAFSSNSTAHPAAFTKATVQNRAVMAQQKSHGIADKAHTLATERLKQASGLSDLLYCVTRKTETRQRQSERLITSTYFNTKCDAAMYPAPLEKAHAYPSAVNPVIASPEAPVFPAAGRRVEKAVLSVEAFGPAADHYGIVNLAANALHKIGQFIYRYDPLTLRIPLTDALPAGGRQNTRGFAELNQQSTSNRKHRLHLPLVIRRANKRIIRHFHKKNLLNTTSASKETLLSVLAGYLFDTEKGGIAGHTNEVKLVARQVLAAAGLYGAKKHEELSTDRAESIIRYWVFSNILGMSPEEYIARKVAADAHPLYYTVSSIHHALSLQKIHESKLLHLPNIPNERWGDFNAMWFSFLMKEMPILKFEEKSVRSMTLSDYNFASLYTGSRFLEDVSLVAYTRKEAIKVGRKMWKLAANDGITEDKIVYFHAPSLFFTAAHSPDRVNQERNLRNIRVEVINDYSQYRKMVEEMHQVIIRRYNDYQTSLRAWLSKGKLADKIIDRCPTVELPVLADLADSIRSKEQRRVKAALSAKQYYLNGMIKPCDSAPESLNDEYQKLTSEVADRFYELDKYLVRSAFSGLTKDEYNVIFTPDSIIRPVHFSMRTNRPVHSAYGVPFDNNIHVELKNTDLISVNHRGEERIYALQGVHGNRTEGYKLIQVDRDIRRYIEEGLLNYEQFGGNYKIVHNKVMSNGDNFHYSIINDRSTVICNGEKEKPLIEFFAQIHRDNIYNYLYESGNDKSNIQKIWSLVKNMIPFYDCIDGIIDNNPIEAVPSCLMDAVSFIPVFGQAARLSGKFGMRIARGLHMGKMALNTGSLGSAAKTALKEIRLPATSELASLGKDTLRSIDPGFELMTGLSRKLGNELINFLASNKKTAGLARGIISSGVIDKLPLAPSGVLKMALLPRTNINVPIKIIGYNRVQEIYARINPETGEAFGKRYLLDNGKLTLLRKKVNSMNNLSKFPDNLCALGRLKRSPGNICMVNAGEWRTAHDSVSVLSTDGLMDCSALAVLSGWNGNFYEYRALIHIYGSNVSSGLVHFQDASELIYKIRQQLIGDNAKIILVGGMNSESDIGLSLFIGQSHFSGTRPILELINMPDVSTVIAGSSGISIKPNGAFSLKDDDGCRGVLTEEQARAVMFDA
ncbi:hypothetical protein [Sodalis sp. dw_96]|uniref:hypothetical protein n=1 Tax=Sodalis sp. dw_96 TaxID=2719794 RepID=UPI001BD56460|nr:hypothetical protein [Sodalis sp. dw_96]